MNKIVYNGYTFEDTDILSINLYTEIAPIGETLSADTLTTVLRSETDISAYTYGTPFLYYRDDTLVGKYFVKTVTRTGKYSYKFECISVVGMLINITHYGGLYEPYENESGETIQRTVGEIVTDIFSNIDYVAGTDYYIDDEVKNCTISGYLKVQSCRDALQQVMFAIGANVMKGTDGKPYIKYNRVDTPAEVGEGKLYLGGSVDFLTPATKINVTEHSYIESDNDTLVTLFDNTDGSGAVTNRIVTFDNPCHDLDFGELTEVESGVNYAIVTGTGTLTGKEYSHITRVISSDTDIESDPKEVSIEDATLVSNLNSLSVIERVKGYYSVAKEVSYGLKVDNERCGDYIKFTDPFGKEQTGIIKQLNQNVSSIVKANSIISADFVPDNFGNNYNTYQLITSGTTWVAPRSGTLRLVLGGGGYGGQAGYNGANGDRGVTYHSTSSWSYTGKGGAGGAKATGGGCGKVLVVDVQVKKGQSYNIEIGVGGTGGSANGESGEEGSATTITINGVTYTSDDGYTPTTGYQNTINGDVYSLAGADGVAGGDGGDGDGYTHPSGYSVIYNGVTYNGGAGGKDGWEAYGQSDPWANFGGGGGGACAGANGSDGGNGSWAYRNCYSPAGAGGAGASVTIAITTNAGIGGGGDAGLSGGGGGGGGNGSWGQDTQGTYTAFYGGSAGAGGSGGSAGNGGSGYILCYY